ncbi:hypothetical protein FRB90_004198 [Tulasnella sp. 427]|nr:hypothetical protein FRB90_004198 [Tulasnella sp. 427]
MYWAGLFPSSEKEGYLASLSGFQGIRCLTMDTFSTWALSDSLGARNDGWSASFPGLEQISISLTEPHNHIFDWVSQLLKNRRTIHRKARTTDCLRVIKFGPENLSTNSAIETLQAPEGEHFLSLLDVSRTLDVQIWWDGVLKSSERDEAAAPA